MGLAGFFSDEACEGLTFACHPPTTHATWATNLYLSLSVSSGGAGVFSVNNNAGSSCYFASTYLADKRQQIDRGGCCWAGLEVLPHNKQAHLLHKPIASLWPVRYSVSCHATQHTRPVEEGQGSILIFIVLLKQCRSVHGKRSHYYYYFIMEGEEEWVRACNQESG